jgi:hypothetical protein
MTFVCFKMSLCSSRKKHLSQLSLRKLHEMDELLNNAFLLGEKLWFTF